jgi:serine/threonine-protein kinase
MMPARGPRTHALRAEVRELHRRSHHWPDGDLSSRNRPGPGQPVAIAGYRLDRYAGQGSTAVVYLASDERLHRQVALKVLAPDLARDAAFRTRMIRQSRAAAALGHPHIIPVYEADEAGGTLYVAMRYADGGDVRSLLNRLGPLPPGYAWPIIAQISSALDAAHAHGLVHGDVRPANILLDASDMADERALRRVHEPGYAYLSDFGMSKTFSTGQMIATGQVTGALDYVAPEQIEGRALDGRTDLYSLACTAFELLCGTPPFGQDQGLTLMYAQLYAPPPAVTASRAELPAAVDLVLATALAKNPADRYPSCGRFARELGAALGLPPGPPAAPPPRSPGRAALVTDGPAAAARDVRGRPGRSAAEPSLPGPDAAARPAGPGPGPSAPRARRLRPLLAVAAVAAVTAAIASGVALSKQSAQGVQGGPGASSPAAASPPPSRPPSPSAVSPSAAPAPALAARQAAALSALLTSSAAARTALHEAVGQVVACTNLPSAVSQLQDVVNQRASEYSRASALPTSALPDGPAVKSGLVTLLSSSLRADQDYLTWARQQLDGGCTPSAQSSAYNTAYSASQQADAAKEAFLQVWNPVAARYGIEQNSSGDI